MTDKLIDCPKCAAIGKLAMVSLFDKGCKGSYYQEYEVPCDLCNGVGKFTEEDYIVMKLNGELDYE